MRLIARVVSVLAIALAVSLATSANASAGAKPPPPGTPPPEITPPPGQLPPPLVVQIAITSENCIDVDSHGVVPVVLYGSATVDVTKIARSTLRLAGAAPANGTSSADRQNDGYLDLKVHFRQSDMTLPPGSTTLTLTGLLFTGQPIVGAAPLDPCGD